MSSGDSEGTGSSETDARFYFTLKTPRAARETTLHAHRRYVPGVWNHIAATYDGQMMTLFINQARVGVSRQQSRDVFTAAAAACKTITLGGNTLEREKDSRVHKSRPKRNTRGRNRERSQGSGSDPISASNSSALSRNFRGTVDELRIWSRALKDVEVMDRVKQVMRRSWGPSREEFANTSQGHLSLSSDAEYVSNEGAHPHGNTAHKHASPGGIHASQPTSLHSSGDARIPSLRRDLYLHDSFDDQSLWLLESGRAPRTLLSDLSYHSYDMSVTVPLCGQTVCDNPQTVLSYAAHWQLRSWKHVRYRVINLMNDDASNPIVDAVQINNQHKALTRAFGAYNISFQLEVHEVRNTTLRRRFIMFGCEPETIGDGICNRECQHERTGLDGGDCDFFHSSCNQTNKGNGKCDYECNKHYHDWDGGDCCLPGADTHHTCYDPESSYR